MKNKIRIKLIQPTTQKLAFVKLIKDCSDMGLKESKDLCDFLHANPGAVKEFEVRKVDSGGNYVDFRKKFANEIKGIDGKFVVNGSSQWERNVKMLKLGIGDTSEYCDAIKENILDNLDSSEELLNFVLTKLSKQELEEVIKDSNLGVASNGVLYSQDNPGLIADILDTWFKQRVEFRKLEKKYGEAGDTEKYEFYAKRQFYFIENGCFA